MDLQCPLDDFDGPIDSGTESARLREKHFHYSTPITCTENLTGIPARG
jgi:hypothetical protein